VRLDEKTLAVLWAGSRCRVFTSLGQNGFDLLIPNDPPADVTQVGDSWASVKGHWVPVDPSDVNSRLAGPSTSEISCDRAEKVCRETQANITVMGNSFSLTADYIEYTVERWNNKEIVASNVGGVCRVRSVIKFDLVNKKVYFMQALSEPVTDLAKLSKDVCNATGMSLELKNSTMWRKP